YAARGIPWGPDDGTLCGSSVLASLVFAPELALPAMRKLYAQGPTGRGELLHASSYNPTARAPGSDAWVSEGEFGLDQGMIVLVMENFRWGFMGRRGRGCPFIRKGWRRAGFSGGWL